MIDMPVGRVFDTTHRDLLRSLARATDPGPARPTKTLGGGGFSALSAPADDEPALALAATEGPEVLRLVGGWSLTTDTDGHLVAVHDDGSRAVLATRATTTDQREDGDHG